MNNGESGPKNRKRSPQQEAGAATRAETRRRLLAAAIEVFTESGYAAATVNKIADRADVSLQTLYSAWGSKRNLLRAMLDSQMLGDDPSTDDCTDWSALLLGSFDVTSAEPHELIARLAHGYRLLSERAAVGLKTYVQAAAMDPEVASDWNSLMAIRRTGIRTLIATIDASELRPGLTPASAGDTAYVIASPHTHQQLVSAAGFTYDEFENWIRDTMTAALLPDQS